MKDLTDETGGQTSSGGAPGAVPAAAAASAPAKARRNRRNVAISGEIYLTFSRQCKALELKQQDVADQLLSGWNRRHSVRARKAMERHAAALCPG